MDEDMSDEPLPYQQDLTCPVCQGIFQDPMLLPCTHSFCRECLQKSWQVNRKCPVCRKEFEEVQAIPNRALKDTAESFLKQSNRRTKQYPPSEEVCNLHLKPLELFCEKDEEPVCVDCVTLHSMHRLFPLKEAAPMCKKELGYKVQILEKKVKEYTKISLKFNSTVEYVKYQAGQAEKQIKAEFERLRQYLVREEVKRLKALANEEEEKIADIQELIAKTDKDIVDLNELIDSLKKEMGNEDLPLLRNFQKLKRRAQWTNEEPCLPYCEPLLVMSRHVGGLSFNIWKNMQAVVNYYPVVLDPNSASPWLSLNEDLTSMKESAERLTVPDNNMRFDPCVFVLGTDGYDSGKHKWDVIVSDNPKWIVGVCNDSVIRKKRFTVSPARGVWAIGLSKGVYMVHTKERTELQVQQRPERIRIKLNIEKGEVSFWDGGRAKHLVTLTHKFEEKVFPIFGPGLHTTPMALVPGKIAVHTS
ncbi:tripartite motif containing 35-28 [Odontesthes bonariensis]|uniref:tripartite motif containing 35-28 n=1 Tax=Odontesthes bonariensis TaxID=219752 RepID=UPI003F58051E